MSEFLNPRGILQRERPRPDEVASCPSARATFCSPRVDWGKPMSWFRRCRHLERPRVWDVLRKKTAPRQKGRSESSVEFSRSTSVLQTQQVLDEIIKLLAIFQRANKTFGHDRDIRFDDVLDGFVRNRDGIRLGHVP